MKIKWTKSAELDIEDIRNYIGRDSEYYANRFIGKIIEATEKLEKFPEIGHKVKEAEDEKIRGNSIP